MPRAILLALIGTALIAPGVGAQVAADGDEVARLKARIELLEAENQALKERIVRLNKEISDKAASKGSKPRAQADLPADALPQGSIWVGEMSRQVAGEPRASTHPVIFTVQKREGLRFQARFDIDNGSVIREVNGWVRNGKIGWLARDAKVIQGHLGQDHEGEIKGDEMRLVYRGFAVASQNRPVSGIVRLSRRTANN